MSKNDTSVSTTMKALEVETPVTETKNPMVSDSSDDEEGDNQMVSDPRQGFLIVYRSANYWGVAGPRT